MRGDWKPIFRKKIIGAFLGIAIGDALGMPVETMTSEEIRKKYGRVRSYIQPKGHKWYDGWPAGRWTDDTQLTLAIAESLIEKGEIDLKDIAARHVEEFDKCSIGWGGSTKNSVERLKNGVSPFDSGNPSGAGNGVAMKVMPIGLKMVADFVRINKSTKDSFAFEKKWDEYRWGVYRNTVHLALMTHRSAIAAASALSQIEAAFVALRPDPEYAFDSQFMNPIVEACWIAQSIVLNDKIPDKLSYRMVMLNEEARFKGKSVAEMAEMFGGATCYVYNSLPFCYAAFLYGRRKSTSLLYDVASAGGDTDSNASIVGGLQGALYGSDLFPKHLIDGLWNKERVISTAERFYEKFFAKL